MIELTSPVVPQNYFALYKYSSKWDMLSGKVNSAYLKIFPLNKLQSANSLKSIV